eukprot:CAMPEP_0182423796 /NCGR_PEP_ID=MMETSP1167-20130531/9851_1 /TAXON_ID=2988 /ORGANISM="Mallomonas Sp, Strain CCMP3275" /LENGTH=366 /DNA_ID=CAMNT_0024603071 /DNA_START=200 /DNA_END=1300 /DNA_ORIENTATION=+
MNMVRHLGELSIDSYQGHEFAVKYSTGSQDQEVRFKKGPEDETVTVTFDKTLGFMIKQQSKTNEVKASLLESCDGYAGDITDCVADILNTNMKKQTEFTTKLVKYRDAISERLRNYTCDDDYLNTSQAISHSMYTIADIRYNVDKLFEMDSARIWTVEDFITDEECDYLMDHSRSRLQRATVAAPDGSSTLSTHRRAQQAEYKGIMKKPDDPLWDLYHRIIKMNNKLTGWNLKPEGQENIAITQYNIGDEYTPHCDGACDGTPYKRTARISTAVMYCKTADIGGGTTFTKADVFVKPKKGMATFFSYRGEDGNMDSGFTEHSGCPVKKGEKWIATLWMREHVSLRNPWYNSDPMGMSINYFSSEDM